MGFQPLCLQPTPDPDFVRQLKMIDPALRVDWAQNRYLLHRWVIEKKIDPIRYAAMYHSVVCGGQSRFIDQPIFDDDQPIYNLKGEIVSHHIVGYRQYDLAPEYEWLRFVETEDRGYRPLGSDVLLELRREYAWNQNHWLTRLKIEREEQEKLEAGKKQQRLAEALEGIDEVKSELGIRSFSKPTMELT